MFRYRLQQVDKWLIFQILEQKVRRVGFNYIASNGWNFESQSQPEIGGNITIYLRGLNAAKDFIINKRAYPSYKTAQTKRREIAFALKEFKNNYREINLKFQKKCAEGNTVPVVRFNEIGIQGPALRRI